MINVQTVHKYTIKERLSVCDCRSDSLIFTHVPECTTWPCRILASFLMDAQRLSTSKLCGPPPPQQREASANIPASHSSTSSGCCPRPRRQTVWQLSVKAVTFRTSLQRCRRTLSLAWLAWLASLWRLWKRIDQYFSLPPEFILPGVTNQIAAEGHLLPPLPPPHHLKHLHPLGFAHFASWFFCPPVKWMCGLR